jgi:hypothetical protein
MTAFLTLLVFAPALFAPAQQPPEFKVIADLANYLSEGNAPGAMEAFDKSIPNYQTISNNIFALVSQADVSCTIDPVEQNGSEIEVDWFMKLNSKADQGPTERRQMTVKLTIEKVGKRYRIKAIDPPSILAPPTL